MRPEWCKNELNDVHNSMYETLAVIKANLRQIAKKAETSEQAYDALTYLIVLNRNFTNDIWEEMGRLNEDAEKKREEING